MAWSAKKIALVASGTAVGGAVCFLTAGAAAPAVGAFIGSTFMGLSGAAATSAGLAAIGGGAVAAGGGGMAAGASLITVALTSTGAVLGTLGMGTMANFFQDSTAEFHDAVHVQKDIRKAQSIIAQQEGKIRDLRARLADEKAKHRRNDAKIAKLEQVIQQLAQVVQAERKQLPPAV